MEDDLFSYSERYPNVPGTYKHRNSIAAATDVAKGRELWRVIALGHFMNFNMTADECASVIGKTVLYTRPLVCEMAKIGYLEDTGVNATNQESGKSATIWSITELGKSRLRAHRLASTQTKGTEQ